MLIDNVTSNVADILTDVITPGDKLSVMTGLFSIYAFDHLKSSLGKVDAARLLFSQAKGFDLLPDEMNCSPFGSLNGGKLETKFRNQLNQKAIAQEFANWLEEKAAVRLVEQVGAVSEHITYVEQSATAIRGAQFNGQGLGLTQTSGFDMISLAKAEQARELLGFFNRVWGSTAQVKEAKAQLQAELSKLTADQTEIWSFLVYGGIEEVAYPAD